MLLPVDDDSCDLLVHEDEDGAQQRGDEGDNGGPPWVGPYRVYNPATIISGWLWRVKRRIETALVLQRILFCLLESILPNKGCFYFLLYTVNLIFC